MRKIIVPGIKDDTGAYVKEPVKTEQVQAPESLITDISIDNLLQRGLRAIYGIMRALENDIGTGMPSRETVQNLKDINLMLWEFKKKEKEFLDNVSDAKLQEMLNK